MSASSSIGPNDPCPCGSGKKYKRCCKSAAAMPRPRWMALLFGVLVIGGAGALMLGPANRSNGTSSVGFGSGLGTRSSASVPQPLGPVPAGKVWSPEHGHWHDAVGAGSEFDFGLSPDVQSTTPQPLGAAPPGKVWSPEHGHWHNAPNAGSVLGTTPGAPPTVRTSITNPLGTPGPQPAGPVPPGKVWSLEHGHWHNAPTTDPAPITINLGPTSESTSPE